MYFKYNETKYNTLEELLKEHQNAVIRGTAVDENEEYHYIYSELTPEELNERKQATLKQQREVECFSVINRGKLWYDTLTEEQLKELKEWYQSWLNVTTSRSGSPTKPSWLK